MKAREARKVRPPKLRREDSIMEVSLRDLLRLTCQDRRKELKRFFKDRDINWTEKAGQLAIDIEKVIEPVVDGYLKKGYSIREIGYIVITTVSALVSRKAFELKLRNVKKMGKILQSHHCQVQK